MTKKEVKKEEKSLKGKDSLEKKLLADKFVNGVAKVKNIYFDPGQPRQMFFFESIKRLAASTGKGVLFNRPILEKMSLKRFKTYLESMEKNDLQQEYLKEMKTSPKKTYEVLVVGASRDLSIIMNCFDEAPVRYSSKLSIEQRRDLQIHEDSQLAPKPWHDAKSNVRLFELLNKQLADEGSDCLSYTEFAKHMGITDDKFRTQREYVYQLSSKIQELVEDKKALDFNTAIVIAKYAATQDEQLVLAMKGLSAKALETHILDTRAEKERMSKQEYNFLDDFCKQDEAKPMNNSGKKEDINKLIYLTHETILKTAKISQLNGDNLFRKNGLSKKTKELEKIVLELKKTVSEEDYEHARKRVQHTSAKSKLSQNLVDILEKVNEHKGTYRDWSVNKLVVLEPVMIPVNKIHPDLNARFGPDFKYDAKEEAKLVKELDIENLANSIYEEGLLNPIMIEKKGREYALDVGFRRWLSHRFLYKKYKEKRWLKIPAIIGDNLTEIQRLEYMINENTQTQFSPEERAKAWYGSFVEKKKKNPDMSIKDFSKKIGKSYDAVQDAIWYMAVLSKEVRNFVDNKLLPYSSAMEIAKGVEKDGMQVLSKKDQLNLAEETLIFNHDGKTLRRKIKEYIAAMNPQDQQMSLNMTTEVNKYFPLAKQVEDSIDVLVRKARSILGNGKKNIIGSEIAMPLYHLEKALDLAKKYYR